jgi:hypothetical protein
MLPVFRERDKIRVPDWSTRNTQIFGTCFRRWAGGSVVCLFPEGTHRGKKQLHLPLKKGAARLIIGAERHGVSLNHLSVVPVGLDYSDYFHPRGELLIRIGKPVKAADLLNNASAGEAAAAGEITEKIRHMLSAEMIDIHAGQDYDEVMDLRDLCDILSGAPDLNGRFEYFRNTVRYFQQNADDGEKVLVRNYSRLSRSLRIRESGIAVTSNGLLYQLSLGLILLLTSPVFIAGYLSFSPIRWLADWFVSTRVKDPLFNNSIRMTFWTVLTPLWIVMAALIAGASAGAVWGWLAALAIPLTGLGALSWGEYFGDLRESRRFDRIAGSDSGDVRDWWDLRLTLIQSIRAWNEEISNAQN